MPNTASTIKLLQFPNLHVVMHPLVQHKLSQLRDKNRPSIGFRGLLREITLLMGYEALRDLPMTTAPIETPVAMMQAPVLAGSAPTLVPIIRAGLAMADAMLELIPTASTGHIGIYRDHDSKQAVEYLVRLPENQGQLFLITDPMLATGNSLIHATEVLVKNGVRREQIRVLALVAAPEGVAAFAARWPDIPIFCAALDSHLNEHAYIVPGLGDAGDRIFGT
jgi:uracil phosphoribosyltransferase